MAKLITHPAKEDKAMCELQVLERQLHAVLHNGMFETYASPTMHSIGHSLHMAQVLAHDIEFLATQLYEQYEDAEAQMAEAEAEREAGVDAANRYLQGQHDDDPFS